MKRFSFLSFFVIMQVVMVVLHIHKHSKKIEISFTKQKYENKKTMLVHKRQELMQELAVQTDRQKIATFATAELQMQPLQLSQIRRIEVGPDATRS